MMGTWGTVSCGPIFFLVLFLLITAVFSRLAVLELNLPTSQGEQNEETPQEMMLEITVRDVASL